MATTLENLVEYLDNRDWNYQVDDENNRIVTGVIADNVEDFWIIIQLSEEGEFIQFIVPELLQIKEHVYKGLIFQTMLNIQWEVKMLRFEYDLIEGNIRASIEIPLENSELTEKQFNRVINALIRIIDENAMPRLKEVLATGYDPGKKKLAENLLNQLPDELVELLEEAIKSRKE